MAGLSILDMLAGALLLALVLGSTWWIERGPFADQSMSAILNKRRFEWMRRAVERDARIVDAALLTTLQNGAAFFASACLIATGGVIALLGEADRLMSVAEDLPLIAPSPRAATEVKLLAVLSLVVTAFLKFAWATRLFSYCAVLVGALPNLGGPGDPGLADQAARVGAQAARSFDRGLRALYFAMAAISWLLSPIACVIGAVLVARLLHRREFRSESRRAVGVPRD